MLNCVLGYVTFDVIQEMPPFENLFWRLAITRYGSAQTKNKYNQDPHHLDISSSKERFVGGKQFIGELCNYIVLSAKEVVVFVVALVYQGGLSAIAANAEQIGNDFGTIDEVTLEGLCVLLDTAGKSLDESALSSCTNSTTASPSPHNVSKDLDQCWNVLKELAFASKCAKIVEECADKHRNRNNPPAPSSSSVLSFRMKYTVIDLLELRPSFWHPIRIDARQGKDMVAHHGHCYRTTTHCEVRTQETTLEDESAGTNASTERRHCRKRKFTLKFRAHENGRLRSFHQI